MTSTQSHKDLVVWQRSMELVKEVYRVTETLPKNEQYGLTSQMRRAAVSIPSNISEGYKRKGRAEYLQFLAIAEASAAELETQLLIAIDVYKDFTPGEAPALLEETQKMLYVMIRKLHGKE